MGEDQEKVPTDDPLSEPALRAAALRYLARFAATGAQVTRVLERRQMRHGDVSVSSPEAVAARIAQVVAALERAGLLNDADYAAMKAASLYRGGASTRKIAATLRDKGVPDALVARALESLDETHGEDRERRAALRYAQRRRFGPWSRPERRADRRLRDIAAMVRAGFPPSLATWAIDLAPGEAETILVGSGENPAA